MVIRVKKRLAARREHEKNFSTDDTFLLFLHLIIVKGIKFCMCELDLSEVK